ncbi:zinc-binding dehydrogenase [Actinoplanes sp. NPDC051494]|uniref:zinc-binding dehydrogenase n=1 Tax=Actinoplanes sp. NPDC051494 TaxID=3363907 RepID=UPI003787D73E
MRAFVITGPGAAAVQDVGEPVAGPGDVVVAVERAGVCGTDAEFYSGHMTYLHTGQAAYPVRIGHEWCGTVASVGVGVDPGWVGKRVTGDTMLGCGHCARCLGGRQHLCADRFEIGIRNGFPGALAQLMAVPVRSLFVLPDSVDATLGALVEPGANALRAVRAADLAPGQRVLVAGPGTIGLLAAMIAEAQGAEVHLLGEHGSDRVWTADDLPDLRWDAVIDASTGTGVPARAVDLVEPGGRVVFIGIAAHPSPVDSRALVLKDVTATGVLSGSGGLAGTIKLYASGAVDPRPLVAATVGLADAATVLSGQRLPGWGTGPKIHIDPRE